MQQLQCGWSRWVAIAVGGGLAWDVFTLPGVQLRPVSVSLRCCQMLELVCVVVQVQDAWVTA
jgi:hypothetical protein